MADVQIVFEGKDNLTGVTKKITMSMQDMGDQTQRAFQKSGDAAKKAEKDTGGSLENIAKKAVATWGALQTLSTGWDMAKQGAGIKQIEASFNSLTTNTGRNAQQYLNSLKAMSQGTISDVELMKAANSALISSNEQLSTNLPQLLQIARSAAQATGADVGQMFNDLVEGIKKGETEILDNLGLTINLTTVYDQYAKTIGTTGQALSQAQKDQALMNEVLRQGEAQMQKIGEAGDTTATKFQQLETKGVNALNKLKAGATDLVVGVSDGFSDLRAVIEGTNTSFDNLRVDVVTQRINASLLEMTNAARVNTAAQEGHNAALLQVGQSTEEAAHTQERYIATGSQGLSVTQQQILAENDLAAAQAQSTQGTLESQIANKELATAQEDLARIASQVASGEYTKEEAAAILQARYGRLGVELAKLIGLQMQYNALSKTGGQGDTLMGREAQRTSDGAQKAIEYANAIRDQQLAMESDAQTAARLRKEMAGLDKDTALYVQKQTELMQLEKKRAGGGGGGSRRSEASKTLEDARRAGEQLVKIEQDTNKRIEEINQKTAERLVEMEREEGERRWQQAKEFARRLDSVATQERVGSGMNDLDLAGATGEEKAQLEQRERLEAEHQERTLQNQTQAYADSQQVSVEYAQRAHEIRQNQNDQQMELDTAYQERKKELEEQGNTEGLAELDRLYAGQKTKLEEATAAELAIALQQETDRKEAAAREKEEIIRQAEEQKAETIKRAQEQAAGIKGATADMQAGTGASLTTAGQQWVSWGDLVKAQSDKAIAAIDAAKRAAAGLNAPGGIENPAGVPEFATGTMGAPAGMAVIHAGEYVRSPSGRGGYVGQGGFANLARGTEVIPAHRLGNSTTNNYYTTINTSAPYEDVRLDGKMARAGRGGI